MRFSRYAMTFLAAAVTLAEPALSQQTAWTQDTISQWSGLPPLPPSASHTKSASATSHCGGSDVTGHAVNFWSTSKDCRAWIEQASELSKHGPTQNDMLSMCMLKGAIFKQAAHMRDTGSSPQFTLSSLASFEDNGFSTRFLKDAINQVYFDPAFTNAGGDALQQQMADICLHPNGHYKPLQ